MKTDLTLSHSEPTRQALARWILGRACEDGVWPTAWPRLKVFRSSRPTPRVPVVYEPCVCVVAQGRKQAFLDTDVCDVYVYDPLNYLILSVPLPVESQIVEASPDSPFLSLKVTIETTALSSPLMEMDDSAGGFHVKAAQLPYPGELPHS